MTCSVMAGIYNEKLLKNDRCDQHVQNICLYVNSIAINLLILGAGLFMKQREEWRIVSELAMLMSSRSILIVIFLAIAGIMSSVVIRFENSITKGVASASETVLVSMIEFFCYGRGFFLLEIFGIMLVSVGTVLYSFSGPSIKANKRTLDAKQTIVAKKPRKKTRRLYFNLRSLVIVLSVVIWSALQYLLVEAERENHVHTTSLLQRVSIRVLIKRCDVNRREEGLFCGGDT